MNFNNFITSNMDVFNAGSALGYSEGYVDALDGVRRDSLSQPELDVLVDFMSAVLSNGAFNVNEMKDWLAESWVDLDKNDPNKQVQFDTWSKTKQLYNRSKKLHNKLSSIQHKLKKMRSN